MPMNWNEAADAKLFAGVLATSEGVKLKYDDLAAWMGSDCTAKAIQHRISTVRKMTKDTDTSTPKVTKPKANGKRKAATEQGEGDGNGEGDDSPTKAKKARAPRKKATPKKVDVAAQDGGDEDGMSGVKDEDEREVRIEDAGIVGGEA